MIEQAEAQTSIKTSDGAAKSAPGWVHWVAASAGATGGAFQLNDSTADGGIDKLDITMPATTTQFFGPFDPPMQFDVGIFVDIPGTNLTVTVGYS